MNHYVFCIYTSEHMEMKIEMNAFSTARFFYYKNMFSEKLFGCFSFELFKKKNNDDDIDEKRTRLTDFTNGFS